MGLLLQVLLRLQRAVGVLQVHRPQLALAVVLVLDQPLVLLVVQELDLERLKLLKLLQILKLKLVQVVVQELDQNHLKLLQILRL